MNKSNFLSQIFNDCWAIDKKHIVNIISGLPLKADCFNVLDIKPIETPSIYTKIKDQAVIQVSGILIKSVPYIFKFFGINATGYDDIINSINDATLDPKIKNITLNITSPGGMVSGVIETATVIEKARKVKPVNAIVEDLCCSAAYWLASCCDRIYSNKTAEIGSIGVYTVLTDFSKMYESEGVKVEIVKSGEFKGTGEPGTEITDNQKKPIQQNVDGLARYFISAVAEGRGISFSDVSELATGQVWLAAEALQLKLIDNVIDLTELNNIDLTKGNIMNDQDVKIAIEKAVDLAKTEQLKATSESEKTRLSDLAAAFPEDLSFAISQFIAGSDVNQAKAAYCDVLMSQKKKAEQTEGDEAVKSEGESAQSIAKDFMQTSRDLAAEKKCSLTEAMKIVSRENPQLHKDFINKQN